MTTIIAKEQDILKPMPRSLTFLGVALVILGTIGIVFPNALALAVELYLGWIMIMGGLVWLYYAYKLRANSFGSWIKPTVLLVGGGLWLAFPASGIAALTLLISFYLFMDAFGSIALAFERRPLQGWFWLLFNGALSLTLAIFILAGWPATSAFYLGVFVGISLLFDGISLLMLSMTLKEHN
jgi:uncharacterized membrane protein HdeD (DUF308 family)